MKGRTEEMADSNNLIEQILESAPSRNTVFLILSKLKEEGRIDEVINGCLNTLNYFPDYIPLRQLLAEVYIEKGSFSLAENELKSIASEIKNFIPVFKSLGDIYLKQGKQDKASNALNIYLAHYPDDEEAHELIANIIPEYHQDISEENIEPIEEYKEDVIPEELSPAFSEQNAGLDTLTIEIDDLSDTQIMHDQVKTSMSPPDINIDQLEEDEFSELATPTLAEIYYNQGQIEEAIRTYERVLMKDPNDRKSMERLAEIKASFEQNSIRAEKLNQEESKDKMISVLEGWLSKIQEKTSPDKTKP
jgi:tetratricopeptide (TPR) repeat protein